MIDTSAARCSGCGYELAGLPAVGQCPECGQSFDVPAGIGIGVGGERMRAHERGDRFAFYMKVGFFAAMAAAAMLLGALRAIGSDTPGRPLLIGFLFAAAFGFAAAVTWLVDRQD